MTQESDLEKAALLAGINNAIPLLGEYEKEPGVLASPPDRIACLLQTAFARWATEKQSLEELPIGNALEAKFDGDDWHWVRTFWWMMKGAREIRILRTAEDPVAIALQIEAAPVPEPSLLLALAVGLISFAYVRQRRRVRLLKLQ